MLDIRFQIKEFEEIISKYIDSNDSDIFTQQNSMALLVATHQDKKNQGMGSSAMSLENLMSDSNKSDEDEFDLLGINKNEFNLLGINKFI